MIDDGRRYLSIDPVNGTTDPGAGLTRENPAAGWNFVRSTYDPGPGDTVEIVPGGVLSGEIQLQSGGGGSASAPLIFEPYDRVGRWSIDRGGASGACFRVDNSGGNDHVRVYQCDMLDCQDAGIEAFISPCNDLQFIDCSIDQTGDNGARVSGADIRFIRCEISNTQQTALFFDDCQRPVAIDCYIHDYGRVAQNDDGITVGNGSTDAYIAGNEITGGIGNIAHGIDITTGTGAFSSGFAIGNYIHDNAGYGIGCNPSASGFAMFYGNVITNHRVNLWPKGGGGGEVWVVGNMCADSDEAGLRISTSASALPVGNQYHILGNVLAATSGRPVNLEFDTGAKPATLDLNQYSGFPDAYRWSDGGVENTDSTLAGYQASIGMEGGTIDDPIRLRDANARNPAGAAGVSIYLPDLEDAEGVPIARNGLMDMRRYVDAVRYFSARGFFWYGKSAVLRQRMMGIPRFRRMQLNEGQIRTSAPF